MEAAEDAEGSAPTPAALEALPAEAAGLVEPAVAAFETGAVAGFVTVEATAGAEAVTSEFAAAETRGFCAFMVLSTGDAGAPAAGADAAAWRGAAGAACFPAIRR